MSFIKNHSLFVLVFAVPVFFSWLAAPMPDTAGDAPADKQAKRATIEGCDKRLFEQNQTVVLEKALALLQSEKHWGKKGDSGVGGTDAGWKFTGVVVTSSVFWALIEHDQVVKRYVKGDILPSGETLVRVETGFIELMTGDGVRYRVMLYPRKIS